MPSRPRPVPREEPKTPPMGLRAQPAPAPASSSAEPAPAKPSPAPTAAKPAPAPAPAAAGPESAAKQSPSPVARPKPKAAATSGAQTKATAGLPANEPYGAGSALPLADGSAPSPDYTIKGNASSKLFHTPSSPYYGRTIAEVWFRTEEDAKRAGFTGWVRKSSTKR